MKYYVMFFCCFALMGFKTDNTNYNLDPLYQNWHLKECRFIPSLEITYKSSEEFGDFYGYQFRKNGTVVISRCVGSYPQIQNNFEEVKGKWKIDKDSILSVSYKSNNRTYKEQLIIRKLTSHELVIHVKKDN